MTVAKLKDGLNAIADSEAAKWIDKINAAWRASVVAIIETGELLSEAKKSLPHGRWLPMIKSELPFSARTAQSLMQIAADRRIRKHIEIMPASWGTLREISQLSDAEFKSKLEDGKINPGMERADLGETHRQSHKARIVISEGIFRCDIRKLPKGVLKRIIEHCGNGNDSTDIGECISDSRLAAILKGGK